VVHHAIVYPASWTPTPTGTALAAAMDLNP
jgi:hypothetical protein